MRKIKEWLTTPDDECGITGLEAILGFCLDLLMLGMLFVVTIYG